MSSAPLPARPRLADHAIVRRYRVGGEDVWILHDDDAGEAYRLGPREWALVSQADGTRDLEGILAAAARAGAFARRTALEAFLGALHEANLLAEGIGPVAEPKPRLAEKPLDLLPSFSLRCDGRGSCCRFYSSVLFRPKEEAYARAVLPLVLDAGDRPEQAFMPLYGSSPCGASAIGLVDGRCAYLAADGRCGIHAAAGAQAKPLGCRMYPARFVDDGQAVRVAPAVECACVLASAIDPGEGEPLVPVEARSSHDLDESVSITELALEHALTSSQRATREDLARFTRAIALAPPPEDVLRALLGLADVVAARGLDPEAALAVLAAPPPIDASSLRPHVARFAARAARRARVDASYRSPSDLARRAVVWLRDAATSLAEDPSALEKLLARKPTPREAASEAFYLRAGAHAYRLVEGELPICEALQDRAARILLARALPEVVRPDEQLEEPALEHPLALVEATVRAFLT